MNMPKKQVIIITGSIATGKTTLAKKLCKKKNYHYLDVNKVIQQYKLAEGYDEKRKAVIVDTKKLNKKLINIIKTHQKQGMLKGIIIDSHLSHYLPKQYVDLCIVTKCNLKKLKKRLQKRKYGKQKIRENLDCEIFDICLQEAKEKGHKIKIIITS